jgi:hypothetical protein
MRRPCLLLFLGVLLLTGCSGGPDPSSRAPRIPDDAPFLLAPATGFREALPEATAVVLREAHRSLVERGEVGVAYEASRGLLQSDSLLAPAIVLAAQADLVDGRLAEVVERLQPVVERFPEYDAALLALGRAAERLNSPVAALEAYGALAERSRLASSRLEAVRKSAVQTLETEVEDFLAARRFEEAESRLRILQKWAPHSAGTLRASVEFAAARGDSGAELAALRELSEITKLEGEMELRRARLELDVGDASSGLRTFQDLAAANPDNPRFTAELARAEFLWRLGLLPEKVKEVAGLPDLKRADLAVLLYWLFPSVRYGQSGEGRIANDVLDHPYREEIVRVANLGIMSVDPRLHRFDPALRLTRATAIVSILRVMSMQRHPPACLEGHDVFRRLSDSKACDLGMRCGIIEDTDSCRPSEATSGRTALDWTRVALDQLGEG